VNTTVEPAERRYVKVCEMGPRDGLQNEARIVTTSDKVRYIDLLSAAGLPFIETTSFVRPSAIPQLADAEDVMARVARRPGTTYAALVPNLRGLERARASGVRAIAVFTAASETFTRNNINMSIDESLRVFAEVARAARAEGLWLRAYVSTAFGCPFEGAVPLENVVRVANALAELGVDEISIGDTIGVAKANDVYEVAGALQTHMPIERIAMHFHDTYGNALDNVRAALAMNVSIFDSSGGGLGGCPYAPGASGNVATEDVLALLHEMNVETGVDLEGVRAATRFAFRALQRDLAAH
jgi:hydroxymethylglutaryl-CoA lyase